MLKKYDIRFRHKEIFTNNVLHPVHIRYKIEFSGYSLKSHEVKENKHFLVYTKMKYLNFKLGGGVNYTIKIDWK